MRNKIIILLAVCLVQVGVWAGSNNSISEKYHEIWKEHNVMEPEKSNDLDWSNASALILYQSFEKEYNTATDKILSIKDIIRFRIKILDKASLEKYSKFYFTCYSLNKSLYYEEVAFGLKVIKSNGKEYIIDLDDQSVVETEKSNKDIPESFKKLFNGNPKLHKLAVSNLEVGDIVDYFIVNKSTLSGKYPFASDIRYLSLHDEYPIVNQKFDIKLIGEDLYINAKSINGAPEFKSTTISAKEYKASTASRFVLEDKNRKQIKNEYFDNTTTYLPTVKFKLYYVPEKKLKKVNYFLGKPGKINATTPTLNDHDLMFKNSFVYRYTKNRASFVQSQIKAKNISENKMTIDIHAKLAYHYYLKSPKSGSFLKTIMKYCRKNDIEYEVAVIPNKSFTTLEDVMFVDEIYYGVILKKGNEEKFIMYNGQNSTYQDFDYTIQNVKGLAFNFTSKPELRKSRNFITPINDAEYNSISRKYDVKLLLSENQCDITRTSTFKGLFLDKYKQKYTNPFAINRTYSTYYYSASYLKRIEAFKKIYNQIWEKQLEEYIQDDYSNNLTVKEYKLENFIKHAEGNDVYVNNSHDIIKENYQIEENFKVEDVIQKADDDIILKAGKLFTKQIALEHEDVISRENDIVVNYKKLFEYKLNIHIPETYTAYNLKAFETSFENSFGSIVSKVEVKGEKVRITITKKYNKDFDKKENWSEAIEFLNFATNLQNQKIVFKK